MAAAGKALPFACVPTALRVEDSAVPCGRSRSTRGARQGDWQRSCECADGVGGCIATAAAAGGGARCGASDTRGDSTATGDKGAAASPKPRAAHTYNSHCVLSKRWCTCAGETAAAAVPRTHRSGADSGRTTGTEGAGAEQAAGAGASSVPCGASIGETAGAGGGKSPISADWA